MVEKLHGIADTLRGAADDVSAPIDVTGEGDAAFMRAAYREAECAALTGDVPVGAVLVRGGRIVARGRNRKELTGNALEHAEAVTLRRAQKKLGTWRLTDCTLYVTLEPCAMCAGAIINCRVGRVVFGAYDKRFGCCGTLCNLPADPRFNHRCPVTGGIMEPECSALLTAFFRNKRSTENNLPD
jgi:tRNA(adenine34) deaminase